MDLTNVSRIVDDIMDQSEALVLAQLNELVSRNAIEVEKGPMVLVQEPDSPRLILRGIVKLKLKDQELIERLEEENKDLRARLDQVKELIK